MFSAKNLSPQQLSSATAFILALPISAGIYYFEPVWWVAGLSFIIIFIGSFGLILFMVQQFVYRKIKLIYKLIYQTKASKREEFYYKNILPQKSIDEVREDVEKWAMQKKDEIETLQENEAYRKEFLQNLAHEFKTPISSIKIAADFMANDVNLKKDARLSKYAQIIQEQNQRLNNQVEKVLNVARLEKDSIELKKEIFEVNQTLNEIIINESLKLKQGNITFMPLGKEIYINADKLHFVNVVANIIDNGIKYSTEEPVIDLFLNDGGKDVLLHIRDHGIGINKENQKKLFDKFYRVSTGNVHNIKGFGLGLYYVKNIVNAHGWHIQVQSEPGNGSEFLITIPKFK